MRISVVIATKDRAGLLAGALASLESQNGAPGFEAIVVDNGSTDDTRGVVERHTARAAFSIAYVYEPEPNRGKARNRGIAVARGDLIVFCDDDVRAPEGWLAAHARAHDGARVRVVNGPILNVASYGARPKPTLANYSRAFLCTCNASVPRSALTAAGGFDETFNLYGWEDTELGVRLREAGAAWRFAWDAAIWHVKPPGENTLAVEARKAVEKARMAARFVEKHPSRRARMATGAHALNLLRGRLFVPERLLAWYAGVATIAAAPAWMRTAARGQFLDGIYARELVRSLSHHCAGDAP